jgi:hypothetical protein
MLSMNCKIRDHPEFQEMVRKIEKNISGYYLLCKNYTKQVGYNLERFRWLEKNPWFCGVSGRDGSLRSPSDGPRIRKIVLDF